MTVLVVCILREDRCHKHIHRGREFRGLHRDAKRFLQNVIDSPGFQAQAIGPAGIQFCPAISNTDGVKDFGIGDLLDEIPVKSEENSLKLFRINDKGEAC